MSQARLPQGVPLAAAITMAAPSVLALLAVIYTVLHCHKQTRCNSANLAQGLGQRIDATFRSMVADLVCPAGEATAADCQIRKRYGPASSGTLD